MAVQTSKFSKIHSTECIHSGMASSSQTEILHFTLPTLDEILQVSVTNHSSSSNSQKMSDTGVVTMMEIIFHLYWYSYWYDFHTVRLSYRYDFHTGTIFIPVRFSYRTTFIPVRAQRSSYCGPVFVYMTPVRNFVPVRIIPVRVHPGNCTGTTRSRTGTTFIPVRDLTCKHPLTASLVL